MKKAVKIILIVFASLLLLLIIALAGAYMMFKNEINAISSIECLDPEKHLYKMEYSGDYGIDKLMSEGGADSDSAVSDFCTEYISKGFYKSVVKTGKPACSVLSVSSPDGVKLYGRNFDWDAEVSMVLVTKNNGGYASITTIDLENLGYTKDYLPDNFGNSFIAAAAPYVPMDGMNEKGLCVSDLEVNNISERTNQDNGLPDVTTTVAIRLMLDKCASTDEAVALLKQYDMHGSANIMHHISISDVTGNSVVVEYVNNEMIVTPTDVLTNFYIYDGEPEKHKSDSSYVRYETLSKLYSEKSGIMTANEVTEGMKSVSQTSGTWKTEWSVIYDQTNLQSDFYYMGNFDKKYHFELK